MSKVSAAVVAAAIVVGWPSPAWGRDVRVEVRWSGAAPTDVLVSVPGGVESLARDAAGSVFWGVLNAHQGAPQRRTITVRYGNYNHPFDVRLHPLINKVAFKIDHRPQRSCTRRKVREASVPATGLLDAIKRAVDAGELMNIREPNACNNKLRFAAAKAKLLQTAAMSELSEGLFVISNQVKYEYREAARRRGESADTEIASLEKRDEALEVRQLLASRTEAQRIGDYSLAMDINNYMADRLGTNQQVAALYASQGVTKAQLDLEGMQIQYAANPPPNPHVRAGERGRK